MRYEPGHNADGPTIRFYGMFHGRFVSVLVQGTRSQSDPGRYDWQWSVLIRDTGDLRSSQDADFAAKPTTQQSAMASAIETAKAMISVADSRE